MLYHKAHVPLLGFEATGNQLGVENSELQKMLRPAEPNCVNWDHKESGAAKGYVQKGVLWNEVISILIKGVLEGRMDGFW